MPHSDPPTLMPDDATPDALVRTVSGFMSASYEQPWTPPDGG